MKRKIFVASSTKGKPIATALYRALNKNDFDVTHWESRKVIRPTEYLMEGLLKQLDETEFGAYILSPDHKIANDSSREIWHPGQNVVLEAGLAIGRHGLQRTFLIADQSTAMPTDLGGIKALFYDGSLDINVEMEGIAAEIRQRSEEIPPISTSLTSHHLSFVKVVPGRHQAVTKAIHKTAQSIAKNKGGKFSVHIEKTGIVYGEWDVFFIVSSPDIEATTYFIKELRHHQPNTIESIDTRQLFPHGYWILPQDEQERIGKANHHLILLSCRPHQVERTFKDLVNLAKQTAEDPENTAWKITEVAILFGRHDIFFIVSANNYELFYDFIHARFATRIEMEWLRENTTSLEIEYR